MRGVELVPEFVRVGAYRRAMFHTYDASGVLAGLLIGMRRDASDTWTPAIDRVTVECVVVQGRSLNIGPWQDLIADSDIGWPLFGNVHAPQSFVVHVRNDAPELRELRAVLVLHGDEKRRAARRRTLRP